MTVAEMIEWLKTQDQAATVYVVSHSGCIGYYDQGGTAQTVVFDPTRHAECRYMARAFMGLSATVK